MQTWPDSMSVTHVLNQSRPPLITQKTEPEDRMQLQTQNATILGTPASVHPFTRNEAHQITLGQLLSGTLDNVILSKFTQNPYSVRLNPKKVFLRLHCCSPLKVAGSIKYEQNHALISLQEAWSPNEERWARLGYLEVCSFLFSQLTHYYLLTGSITQKVKGNSAGYINITLVLPYTVQLVHLDPSQKEQQRGAWRSCRYASIVNPPNSPHCSVTDHITFHSHRALATYHPGCRHPTD